MNLHPSQSNILWATSWITLYPTVRAIQQNKYDLALGTGAIFLTSINFWKDPSNYMNKIIDITMVRCVFVQQLYKSILDRNINYWILITASISCYLLGCKYYNNHNYWAYTYCHMSLHILSNFGVFALLR